MKGSAIQPRQLGAYRLVGRLGAGAMGTVYLAENEDGPFALKIVHPRLLERRGFFKRFQREADAGSRVRHANVVRTFDCDLLIQEGTTYCFLVMEYVEGRTLWELLGDLGTLPETLLREVARQVAAGLQAIHGEGLVHRDLKPENVLITDDHDVRIMDLGVARAQDATRGLTDEGAFAGTLLYAAPEQFRGGEIGPATDLYALGVTLYELATGTHPFRHDDASAILHAHLHTQPTPARDANPEVSPFMSEVLAVLLAKEPERRFESAAALLDVLRLGERSSWWAERESAALEARGGIPAVPVRRETRLHGREDDLALLDTCWQTALRGKGCAVLLEGEAGIGKTRLVDAFLGSLSGESVHVLYGSYPPTGGMGGLSDAILGKFGLGRLEDALGPYLTTTPRLAPAFAATVKHESAPRDAEPLERDALHAVFCHLLRGLAAEKPVVWVVEDLHFADAESRGYVLSLARALAELPVVLLLTTRPGLPQQELANFSRLRHFRRTGLGRLSPRAVVELLRDAFRSAQLAEKLGAKIAYKSDGVPFFVFEMIRGLRDGQFIERLPDGTYVETRVVEEIEVPDAVRDLIEARLRDLTEEQRAILDVGAVQGFEFDPDLVRRVCDEKPVRVLRQLAEIERRSGVVRSTGARYRFDHHQLQEVLYEVLPLPLRQQYHSLLADARVERDGLQGTAPADVGGEAAHFLVSHHLRGTRPGQGLPFLWGALAHLGDSYRRQALMELSEQVLAHEGLLSDSDRVEVLLQQCAGLVLVGRLDGERDAAARAVALAVETGDPALESRALTALGRQLNRDDRHQEAVQALEQALELAGSTGDRTQEASILGVLGIVLHHAGDSENGRRRCQAGLELARALGNRKLESGCLGNLGLIALQHDDAAAQAHLQQQIDICKETAHHEGEAIGCENLGLWMWRRGRLDEALALLQRSHAIARQIGLRVLEGATCSDLAVVVWGEGCLADAMGHLARAVRIARETGSRGSEVVAVCNLGELYGVLGDSTRARELLELGKTLAEEIGLARMASAAIHELGELAERDGDVQRAEAAYQAAYARALEVANLRYAADSLVGLGRLLCGHERRFAEARQYLVKGLALSLEIGRNDTAVLARGYLALLPGSDSVDESLAQAAYDPHIDMADRAELLFVTWQATNTLAHLEAACRVVQHFRDHAPAEYRDTMIENVPLHRDIVAAWREHGGSESATVVST